MSNSSNAASQVISLPEGGGALSGIGEKFSPDLHTGTGNFTVPIALPPGRNGFQPELNLVYSTGNGNGPFGLGWSLSIPGVSRKTADGVPLYNEDAERLQTGEKRDGFILSGAEDLTPISGSYPGEVVYRPRTEGLFARITHHRTDTENYWRVESKDGLVSTYGHPKQGNSGPATVTKPGDTSRIFAWKLIETKDPFGNRICYEYEADRGERGNQLLLKSIRYVDFGDASDRFLVHVNFEYEDEERPDPFSDYRAGFEIRTTRRCRAIKITTQTADDTTHPVREYRFAYTVDSYNGVSLLQQLDIIGFDDAGKPFEDDDPNAEYPKQLPPLTFGYTQFAPEKRRFEVVEGRDLPTRALSAPDMELVDLHGGGLPDILEMNGTVRYWRNLGHGRFDMPRPMQAAPPHALADPGVQMIDANGDGRMDLLVTSGPLAGYYPLEHGARWSQQSFQPYPHAPSFNLDDPEVKLVDLDGDGYTDIMRSGSRLEGFFNDPDRTVAWRRTRFAQRQTLDAFPNVNFSDPRVRLADMTGDGLQDIVLIHDGNVEYWPNLGHNRWGRRVSMRRAPRLRDSGYELGYDPQRLLLGDVDGDGLADLVYVGHDRVLLWINQSGNGWRQEPIVINGTPPVTNMDHVRLVDLHGTGVSGVLWSSDATAQGRHRLMFLDFTGGMKPYVLNEMDNHMGAVTRVEYKPSTYFFLQDQQRPATRWRTPLPFPVQVVARVEVIDHISKGKLTTEYRYHHGYWDGAEREFRGFGMVEQLDTESAANYNAAGLHGNGVDFKKVEQQFSQPTLTKIWFHQGPVGEEFGDWQEVDYTHEYWPEDPQLLGHTEQVNGFLIDFSDRRPGAMPSPGNRRIKRDALRTLRGSILRTELYALDGSERQGRPYTVTEQAYNLTEIPTPTGASDRKRIFFPHLTAQRTTQWERGDDPMTQFAFTSDYDDFGQPRRQSAIAMPRLQRHQQTITGEVVGNVQPNETRVLATHSHTEYAKPDNDAPYIYDRVAQVRLYELEDPPTGLDTADDAPHDALRKHREQAALIHKSFEVATNGRLIGHEIHQYDGTAFVGRDVGHLDQHGALIRSQALVVTGELLNKAYGNRRPDYLDGGHPLPGNGPQITLSALGFRKEPINAQPDQAAYYADTLRQELSPRGLPLTMRDALGRDTHIEYDPHDLLPVKVTDAKGLAITAEYNPRLLQPSRMIEPNDNSTHVRYNPIGLPAKQFVTGHDNQGKVVGGTEDKPEIAFVYDFRHFERTRNPVFVHTTRRIHHASDNISDDTIQSREYSDGFGRLIQTRAQAEDYVFGELGGEVGLPAQPDGILTPAVSHKTANSVVVSGWERFDNKGQVIEKYEPFFATGWDFQGEADAVKGQHASLFYDPRGQVIRTLNPDGSQQRVIFGRPLQPDQLALSQAGLTSNDVPDSFAPTPWESYTYDANDLADLTHQGQAAAPQAHHFTPASVVLDAMGRALCTVARNDRSSGQWHITRSSYDIRGNLRTVTDALGRTAFTYHYDLFDRALTVESIDAGRRTSVLDALGNLIEYRDSKGSLALRTYDTRNRPKELWARNDSAGAFTLRECIQYGDEGTHALARQHNTLGQPVAHYDEAGLLAMPEYDFKGNLLEKTRRTIKDDVIASGWQADWSAANVNAKDALEDEDEVYQTSMRYDALDRPTEMIYPEDVGGARKRLTPRYNRAGALEAARLDGDDYVRHIAYNAKGQRVLIAYGNEIMTRHAYDERTFRLTRLRTEHFAYVKDDAAGTHTWSSSGQPVQDFSYSYDLAGNIVQIIDTVEGCGIRNNPDALHYPEFGPELALGNMLIRRFDYDPLYRLLSAKGRACSNIGQPRPFSNDPRCGFYAPGAPTPNQDNAPDLTEGYTETFEYNPAGNMLRLHYHADSGQWTRRFGMGGQTPDNWKQAGSNRLTTLASGSVTATYEFDANGNLTRQNTEKRHAWDHADRMIGFRIQTSDTSPASIQARYLYGADGMRVKKWVHRGNGSSHDASAVYIDGIFEHHRWSQDGGGANNTLHVMDDQSRIATVRVGAAHSEDAGPAVQYHLGDHLGSSHTVVGGDDALERAFINHEEYFPYGETSFGSFGRKRYRYSGKERDEESGLYYYGARYLAPWVCRWVSCDPAGPIDGVDLYISENNNPIRNIDRLGTTSVDVNVSQIASESVSLNEAELQQSVNIADYADHLHQQSLLPDTISLWLAEQDESSSLPATYNLQVDAPGWEGSGGNEAACYDLAIQGAQKTMKDNAENPTSGGGIVLYTSIPDDHQQSDIEVSATAGRIAIDYIKTSLDEQRAVVVGVNVAGHGGGSYPNQPVTDHFLIITGYRTDARGNPVALIGIDNAVSGTANVEFQIEPDTLKITKHAEPLRKDYLSSAYQLSEVRFLNSGKATTDLPTASKDIPKDDAGRNMLWRSGP